MTALRFTPGGVVSAPTILQIRLSRELPGRIAAGAPLPSRAMSDAEVEDNLRHFVVDRQGPRERPCDHVVLSGVDLPSRRALADVMRAARAKGVGRVTLHLARGQRDALRSSPLRHVIDEVAVGLSSDEDFADVAALLRVDLRVVVVLTLDAPTLARLGPMARALSRLRPDRVVLTWPLAGEIAPPHAARVVAALDEPLGHFAQAGVDVRIKGLPVCVTGRHGHLQARTPNRYYVDAEHQRDRALLFFPDVLRFTKPDACRFCSASDRCDGAPHPWLRAGLTGPLHALS